MPGLWKQGWVWCMNSYSQTLLMGLQLQPFKGWLFHSRRQRARHGFCLCVAGSVFFSMKGHLFLFLSSWFYWRNLGARNCLSSAHGWRAVAFNPRSQSRQKRVLNNRRWSFALQNLSVLLSPSIRPKHVDSRVSVSVFWSKLIYRTE